MEKMRMGCTPLDEEAGLTSFFSFKDLKKATHDFNMVIGYGGYCTVYFGKLREPPGTMGFKDLEFEDVFMPTDKSDVYSLVVVLMELILWEKAVDDERPDDDICFHKMVRSKELEQLIDLELEYENDDIRRVIDSVVALACQCIPSTCDVGPLMMEVLANLKRIKPRSNIIWLVKGTKVVAGKGANIYTYKELKKATNSFSRVIGMGVMEKYTKAKLRDGRLVAVKKIFDVNGKEQERCSNEVDILSRYHHENLVTLI